MSNAVINEQLRKRYAEDPEYREYKKNRARIWRRRNAERIRRKYAEDPEYRQKCKERARKFRHSSAGRESIKRTEEKRRESRKPAKKEYMKGYHGRPEVRTRYNRMKHLRRKNPRYRAIHSLRHRMHKLVANRSDVFSKLIGCSGKELCAHLESQFRPGMSWETYGPNGWHIDHIRPCASFDLTDPAQQRECFHYTNLQPLWAEENVAKGATSPPSPVIRHSPDECPPECPEGCADCVAW